MPSLASFLAASTLASLALAKPVPQVLSKRGFSVTQSVAKPAKIGAVYLANTYKKYNKPVPQDLAAAADGSVTATPEPNDEEYLCPVTIGGQTLNLDFDTGSADLWVFSNELPASQQSGHEIYNPSDSSTAQKLQGSTWKITYGDGSSASGDVYTDTVEVGGTTVTTQAVEPASTISAQFTQDSNNDGLLGLAFSSINTVSPQSQNTFFQTAINEGVLSSNVFTADLKKGAPGTYDFGYIDSSKYTGDITYTSVDNSQGFWSFTASGYGFGDNDFQQNSLSGIADTGTTLMLLDDSIVDAYYQQVSGASYDSSQGGYTFDCSTDTPDFILGVGDAQFTVPGSFINFAPTESGSSTCFGGLQSNSGIGFNIFGDVFLKAIFAIFDSDGPQIGFASKNL